MKTVKVMISRAYRSWGSACILIYNENDKEVVLSKTDWGNPPHAEKFVAPELVNKAVKRWQGLGINVTRCLGDFDIWDGE